MTIRELINALKKYPPEMPVVVKGYEDGFNDIDTIKQTLVTLNANDEWYYGAHAEAKEKTGVPVVLIAGENKNTKREMIPEGWKISLLGDLIEINKSSLKKGSVFDSIEYIDTSSVTENRFSETITIPFNEAPSRAKRIVRDFDIIYSTVRPVQRHYGLIRNPKPNTIVSTGFSILTSKNINPTFLYYYLTQDEIVKYLNGVAESNTTTFPAFNSSLFESMEIVIPKDKSEQSRIASILSSLDDKIELNLRMNKTLEAIAQTIFKEWFVDFRFPGFDGVLVEGLPKGWRKGKLSSVCEIKYGKDHKHLCDGKIPVYGSGGIMRFADTALFDKESILIPRKGTLSNLFYVSQPFWSVDTMFYTKIKEESIRKYLFYLLKTLNLASMNVGSAVPSLTTEVLNKIEIVIPEKLVLNDFESFVSTIYSKMKENNNQIESLTQIRDTLLPKLMTGKIRV